MSNDLAAFHKMNFHRTKKMLILNKFDQNFAKETTGERPRIVKNVKSTKDWFIRKDNPGLLCLNSV